MACWSASARRTASWACCTRSTAITSARTTTTCWSCRGRMRSSIPRSSNSTIAAQRQADPQGAISEWDAEFRSDISAFLSDELIEASINYGRPLELPPQSGITYKAFVDAISRQRRRLHRCHRPPRQGTPDHRLRTRRARAIRPAQLRSDAGDQAFADLCKEYRVGTVIGDNFAGVLGIGGVAQAPDLLHQVRTNQVRDLSGGACRCSPAA